MYAYVDPATDKQFSKQDFEKYLNTNVKFTWGAQDGTGDPLILPIKNYLSEWVFEKDFTKSFYSEKGAISHGKFRLQMLTKFIQMPSTPPILLKAPKKYAHMDWAVLAFVFEQYEGKYYLVGVINDKWTI